MAASPEKKLATASIKPSNDNEQNASATTADIVKAKVETNVAGGNDVEMDMDIDMDTVPTGETDDGQARMSAETIQIMVQALPRASGEKLLSPGGAAQLALDSEYRLREIIQDSMKFMKHSKRSKLLPEDVNSALRLRNLSPTYGFGKVASPAANSLVKPSSTPGPTVTIKKKGTGGTKKQNAQSPKANNSNKEDIKQLSWRPATGIDNLYFTVDKPSNLRKILECPLPPLPLEVTISSHWLAVNGVQPTVPQNPPPSNDESKSEANGIKPSGSRYNKNGTVTTADGTVMKHVLSKELQLYFDHLRQVLFGSDSAQKNSILQSVEEEPGLVQVVPYFVLHVSETVLNTGKREKGAKNANNNTKAEMNNNTYNNDNSNMALSQSKKNKNNKQNVATGNNVQNNNENNNNRSGNGNNNPGANVLLRLTSMMRLVRAMHGNTHFKLESYLHTLFPSIVTCVVRRRLCDKAYEDHWALRDYSARLLRDICDSYRSKYHNTQTRCSRTFIQAFIDPSKALTTHYGAIVGLTIFGKHVVDAAVLPTIGEYVTNILRLVSAQMKKKSNINGGNNSNKKSVRKFEFAKVLGAIVAALNVSANTNTNSNSNGEAHEVDIDRAVQVAVENKLQFNTDEFTQAVRNAEKEFGRRIYPHQKKDEAY